MKRYLIKHAYQLQSHPQKLLLKPGQYYPTESEAEIAELDAHAVEKGCEEVKSMAKPDLQPSGKQESKPAEKKKEEPDPKVEEDITVVPGIGKTVKEKLAKEGITTISGLREALSKREEEIKELLGPNVEKVKTFLEKK